MFTHSNSRGFTLIELLVVIAIIGILASVVLASLNTARTKGQDAAIKSSLNNMRAQAELFYDNNSNSYGSATQAVGNCPTASVANTIYSDATILSALGNVVSQASGAGNTRCASTPTSWVMAAQLRTSDGAAGSAADSYCVDSTGKAITRAYTSGQDIDSAITSGACTP